jgi:hypothetical protein
MKTNLIRIIFLGSLMLATSVNAFAVQDLNGVMKAMAQSFSQISAQVPDPSKNISTESLCDTLSASIIEAKALIPSKVLALPSDQQAAPTQTYVQMLGQLAVTVGELKADLIKGDNASAAMILDRIALMKIHGHQLFR